MSWRLVDGVAVPDPVAGHPALDFCNTRAGWGAAGAKEYLVDFEALTVWTREAGLLDSAVASRLLHAPDRSAGDVLGRAVTLREALYPVALGRGGPDDWAVVSAEAAGARAGQRLVPVPASPGAAGAGPMAGSAAAPGRWLLPSEGGCELVVSAIALVAAELLTSPLTRSVAACPGQGCGWLFADPRGRRRWCSMAVCGNRAKARRHAARRP